MKNLYTKSRGKIHPSPSIPSSTAAVGLPKGSKGDALAVLALLPAAIMALTSALGFGDKEVVAYLMMRSINGPSAVAAAEDRKRCRRVTGLAHSPVFDCGCFECYTSFWSRWDCSPDREIIHVAIEGFEESLARSEKKGKARRRERREKKSRSKEEVMLVVTEENKGLMEEEAVTVSECSVSEVKEEATGTELESPPSSAEKKKGWPDVMGMFNSRLWSLWNPAA